MTYNRYMDIGKRILEKIIEEEGSCTWANPYVCKMCPLSKLQQYESGRYISCVEAINIEGMSEEEADAAYKKAASEKLADLTINDVIENT